MDVRDFSRFAGSLALVFISSSAGGVEIGMVKLSGIASILFDQYDVSKWHFQILPRGTIVDHSQSLLLLVPTFGLFYIREQLQVVQP